MFTMSIQPRFAETDALGHINNCVLPVWFEQARTPIFEIFMPSLDIKHWKLILARIEVEFLAELFYGVNVEIRTFIERVGNSSVQVYQEAWQNNKLCANGRAVQVRFDHQIKKSQPIPDEIRAKLNQHLYAG